MNCLVCDEIKKNVCLLTCKHSLCNPCYVMLKKDRINNCPLCDKRLRRGRKNNVALETLFLGLSFY